MQKRVAKLEAIVEVLQKVHCNMDSPLQEKLYELEKLYGQYSVYTLCEALGVSRGTFYNHVLRNKKQNKSYQARRDMLSEQIKEIYDKNNQIFGAKKIKVILEEHGTRASVAGRFFESYVLCFHIKTLVIREFCSNYRCSSH